MRHIPVVFDTKTFYGTQETILAGFYLEAGRYTLGGRWGVDGTGYTGTVYLRLAGDSTNIVTYAVTTTMGNQADTSAFTIDTATYYELVGSNSGLVLGATTISSMRFLQVAQLVWGNNASTTLAAAINSSQTTITITSSTGWPTIAANQYHYATIESGSGATATREIVLVTARSGTTLTVTRGQGGTSAAEWPIRTTIEQRVTAAELALLQGGVA